MKRKLKKLNVKKINKNTKLYGGVYGYFWLRAFRFKCLKTDTIGKLIKSPQSRGLFCGYRITF